MAADAAQTRPKKTVASGAAAAGGKAVAGGQNPLGPEPDLKDRHALTVRYLPFVRNIAGRVKKTVGRAIEFDDLVEYGVIGLLEAAERFEPNQGTNFMTFAYYRIRGAIYDGLRGSGWLKRSDYAKARFEERANAYLSEAAQDIEKNAPLPEGESAPKSSLEHAVRDLAAAVHGLAAVYVTTLDSAALAELPDEQTPATEDVLQTEQTRTLVRQTLKRLTDKEREMLEMYYYKDMSLQQIGDALGLSKSWTSRMHARIIDKMHRLLAESLPDGA